MAQAQGRPRFIPGAPLKGKKDKLVPIEGGVSIVKEQELIFIRGTTEACKLTDSGDTVGRWYRHWAFEGCLTEETSYSRLRREAGNTEQELLAIVVTSYTIKD